MSTFYGDIGKSAADLVKKGFPSGEGYQWRWNLDAPANEDGTKFTANVKRTHSGQVGGELSTKFNLTRLASTETIKWDAADKLTWEFQTKEKIAKGLTTTLKVTTKPTNPSAATTASVNADYKHKSAGVKFTADVPVFSKATKPVALGLNVLAKLPADMVAGFDTAFHVGDNSHLAKLDVGLQRNGDKYQAAFKLGNDFDKDSQPITASFLQRFKRNGQAGAVAAYDLKKGNVSLKIGAAWDVDATTRTRLALNNNGVLSVGATTKLSPWAKLTLGAEVDTLRLDSPEANHKYSLDVTFGN